MVKKRPEPDNRSGRRRARVAWPGRAPVRHAIRQTGAVSRHKGLKLNALLARTLDEIVDALAASLGIL